MKGLDCGTGNFVCSDDDGIRLQRNAFLSIDKSTTTTKQLKILNVPYVELGSKLHIVGKKAFEYAQVFGSTELRRPMSQGLLNPVEQDAFPILRVIVSQLLGEPKNKGEKVVYCIPGKPLDDDREVDYHEDVMKQVIEASGYEARAINESVALGNAGLVDNQLTGIAISMGAGMCNIAIMYAGMSALQFSVSKGGDWIDQNVCKDTGISSAKAQAIKEAGNYTIDPKSDDPRTREQQAVKTYYEVLIRYLLANIAKQFESQDMPNFPEAVPIVIGGGTSMVNGFIDVFRDQFTQKEFPLNVGDIRLVDEPLTAVSRGCFLEAKLEDG
jgi:hypothetical protein